MFFAFVLLRNEVKEGRDTERKENPSIELGHFSKEQEEEKKNAKVQTCICFYNSYKKQMTVKS